MNIHDMYGNSQKWLDNWVLQSIYYPEHHKNDHVQLVGTKQVNGERLLEFKLRPDVTELLKSFYR